jgi:Tfp pilus assembly protein PilF
MGRALVYMELDELDLARGDLSTAIQVDAESASAYSLRAEVDLALGARESARRDIEKARRLDPEDKDIALLHARLSAVNADYKAALSALDDAIDEEEASLEALLLRSHIRLSTGEVDGAKKDAIRASNTYNDEAFAFVQLAHVQLSAGSGALAMKAAERAVGLDPSLPDGYLARAAALRLSGKEDEAQKDFERASSEPVELPYFLLGPAFEVVDGDGFQSSLMDMLHSGGATEQAAQATERAAESVAQGKGMPRNPFAGMGGLGGLGGLGGGFDPATILDQVFDEDGNMKPALKPLLKMAMKNAPSLMKNMPKSMIEKSGVDPEMLENMDMSNISEEQLEEQMRLFYKMMKNKES